MADHRDRQIVIAVASPENAAHSNGIRTFLEIALLAQQQGYEVAIFPSIAEAASVAAARDVQYLKYVGSCVRLSEGCLVNWATGAAGDCVPPAGYDGPCGATDVSQLSGAEQEEFALRCQAPWPCRDCKTDFEGCPSGWAAVGRLCVAPTEYDGICSPVANFSEAAASSKASWSAMCAARWSCAS